MKENSLSKDERLKSKKDFDLIYSAGKIVYSKKRVFKALFIELNSSGFVVKIAAAVSKKAGKAFWRNRIKRLIKESYRLNKLLLYEHCKLQNKNIAVVISPVSLNQKKNKTVFLKDVQPEVVDLLLQIKKKI